MPRSPSHSRLDEKFDDANTAESEAVTDQDDKTDDKTGENVKTNNSSGENATDGLPQTEDKQRQIEMSIQNCSGLKQL